MNEFTDDQRKHIDIIESTITRMSENSKQMKEWCIVLISGLVSVYFTLKISWLIVIALIATILFGCLDTFYLMLERRYRQLYNDVIGIGNKYKVSHKYHLIIREIPLYGMSTNKYEQYTTYCSALASKSIRPFYGVFSLALIILSIVAFKSPDIDEVTKIELSNKQIDFKIDSPLNVYVKKIDSLKINLDKIDSLLLKIDELKNVNIQIVDTVKTKSFVKKGK